MKFKLQLMSQEGKIIKEGLLEMKEEEVLVVYGATEDTQLMIITKD